MRSNPSGFLVMSKRCNECLFSSNKIVDDDRQADLIETCQREQRHFTCHKATIAGNLDVCCRGFFDRFPGATMGMRLAQMWNLVRFVEESELSSLTPPRPGGL